MPSNPLCLEVEMPANNCPAIKQKVGSSVLEHSIKVRKPYAITKQRERWAEAEHNKFLEALKLYGRAWRQIEEHIGTKTAVQIRSHAQKFFTKVAREMNGDDSGQVKTIEIPPPRPKKKPSHPYPRKLGNSHNNPVMRKQEWSSISNVSLCEQDTFSTPKVSLHEDLDNMSPTSVVSVVGSDTSGSPASDLMNSCTSRVSGTDPAQSATTSVGDEENSLCQPKSDMELDLGTDESIRCKEASSVEAPASCLKLFGQTVVVADAQKQDITDGTRTVQLDGQTQWNSWPNGVTPMCYLFPSDGNLPYSNEDCVVPMPCIWAPHIVTTANFSLEQDHLASGREFLDNGSVESIVGCSVEAIIGDMNTDSVGVQSLRPKFRTSETSAFRCLKAPSSQPAARKGFVPYRRFVVEGKVSDQIKVNDNIGRQLCL